MGFTEQELRRQRALVQQQLDWLDAKLLELENGQVEADAPQTAPPLASVPPAAPPPPPPVPSQPDQKSEPAAVLSSEPPEVLPQEFLEGPDLRTDNTRLGCILMCVLAALLGLFIFWGLPFLIYQ